MENVRLFVSIGAESSAVARSRYVPGQTDPTRQGSVEPVVVALFGIPAATGPIAERVPASISSIAIILMVEEASHAISYVQPSYTVLSREGNVKEKGGGSSTNFLVVLAASSWIEGGRGGVGTEGVLNESSAISN